MSKRISIVGLDKPQAGRSCQHHAVCGHFCTEGDRVVVKRGVFEMKGKSAPSECSRCANKEAPIAHARFAFTRACIRHVHSRVVIRSRNSQCDARISVVNIRVGKPPAPCHRVYKLGADGPVCHVGYLPADHATGNFHMVEMDIVEDARQSDDPAVRQMSYRKGGLAWAQPAN
jgi:hypothetical protein